MIPVFKEKLARGEIVTVVNPAHPAPSLVESLGKAKFDAVMIDTEQGSPDIETVENMARAAKVAGVCPLVRIFAPESYVVERLMLRGVDGIVVPRVDLPEVAAQMVRDVEYCFPHTFHEKLVIIQIESLMAAERIDQFLAIDGIDCYFLGAVDFSKSMGFKGDYRTHEVRQRLERTIHAIVGAGKRAGIMIKEDDIDPWLKTGANFLYVNANDIVTFGARHFIAGVRAKAR